MNQRDDYLQAIAAWRANRLAKLTAEDGWLNLVGLWWLEDGAVSVGASAACDAILPRGAAKLGTASLEPEGFVFEYADAGLAPVRFAVDKKAPTRFVVGDFLFEAVVLAGRTALRIRDRSAAGQAGFSGIECFPIDPSWRIVAEWTLLAQPVHTTVDTAIGAPTDVTITHEATFAHNGNAYALLPTHGTPQAPQFVLRDLTSGKETYPASRFLFGEEITGSTIVLDFNKAINPPCAFTDFAVCPLPPAQNVLPFRIDAGEKVWKG